MTQDQGEVLWNGHHLGEKDYDVIGYLPEERGLYPKVTIQDQLLYFAELRGKSRKRLNQNRLLDGKISGKREKTDKVKSLSKGNQQKSS